MIELAGDDPASTAVEVPPVLGDRYRRIRTVLASFSDEDRKLLHMRFWRNMTIDKVAETLNISYSAAAVRLFRVLKKLEKTLGER